MTTTKEQQCVAIVGSGHAGIQAAESLRLGGFTGRVVLVDSESQYPYQRPPLSKGYLAGNEGSATPLRAESFFWSRDIDYMPDTSALAIHRSRRDLALSDGTSVPGQELVLATGAAARRLTVPGSDLEGIHQLRSSDDAAHLRAALGTARRAVVIGAGFIGLEFAAVAAPDGY